MLVIPADSASPHFDNCPADRSFFAKPSLIASAAISPLLSARKTPEEYMGSRNPKASPTSTHPSPAQRLARYEKSLRTWTGPYRVAPFIRSSSPGQLASSSFRISSGVPDRPLMSRSTSATMPTLVTSSRWGMYQNHPSFCLVDSTSVAPAFFPSSRRQPL